MRTALITGAGRGIGLATAKAFLGAGWRVLALDKDFMPFDATGKVDRIQYDLTDIAGIAALAKSLGEIHTLVNNAGVLYCDPYETIPEAHKREILAVNLEAPVALITALSPQMVARRDGRIVNVGSVAAFTGHPDLWYGITKAAILNLTKSWATQLGRHGVLVNAVAPGAIETPINQALLNDPVKLASLVGQIPLSRLGTPNDVASLAVFLASADSDYVTGTTFVVDGGLTVFYEEQ